MSVVVKEITKMMMTMMTMMRQPGKGNLTRLRSNENAHLPHRTQALLSEMTPLLRTR